MPKRKPADSAEGAAAEVERLEAECATLRKELSQSMRHSQRLQGELREARERLKIAEGIARAVRWADLHLLEEECAIEQIDPATDKEHAQRLLDVLTSQEGCLGGRVLSPKPGLRLHWAAQTFWPVPQAPPIAELFGLYGSALPDGCHYRLIAGSHLRALLLPATSGEDGR